MATNFVSELNNIIASFLCGGDHVDMESCVNTYVYSKTGFQPVCTVKLQHGKIYHLEFVYRFLIYKMKCYDQHASLYFIISNNGIASTLKIFLREPVGELNDAKLQFPMKTDVMLSKNASIIISQDDFIKFKSPLVPVQDLNLFSSLVVCRAYLTDKTTNMQFLIFQPGNGEKMSYLLKMIAGVQHRTVPTTRESRYTESRDMGRDEGSACIIRRPPIRSSSLLRRLSDTSDTEELYNDDILQSPTNKPGSRVGTDSGGKLGRLSETLKQFSFKTCIYVLVILCLVIVFTILLTFLQKM